MAILARRRDSAEGNVRWNVALERGGEEAWPVGRGVNGVGCFVTNKRVSTGGAEEGKQTYRVSVRRNEWHRFP